MTLFSTQFKKEIYIMTDYTSSALNSLVKDLSQKFLNLSVKEAQCGYGCSDHASWTKYSYPSFFPVEAEFESSIQRIHTTGDIYDNKSDENYAALFAQLGIAFAISLGY